MAAAAAAADFGMKTGAFTAWAVSAPIAVDSRSGVGEPGLSYC